MSGLDFEKYILEDQQLKAVIEAGLRETYFSNYEEGFLETELGIQDLQANVFERYNNSLRHVVPWVADHIDLAGKKMVEIGAGTGSSTAAFAHFVDSIHSYDIDALSVEGARKRFEALQIKNASVDLIQKQELIERLEVQHKGGVDVILLFAVLEHQTIEERIATIKTCHQLLHTGGLLVVVETPNLLTYFDYHTSLLPFLHFAPTSLYYRYAKNSPRNGFNSGFAGADSLPAGEIDEAIMRWGRGVSYHDFELALGVNYADCIVANGFEKQILEWVDVSLEEEVLRYYIEQKGLSVPAAFTRVFLNFIMKKGQEVTPCEDKNIPAYKLIASQTEIDQQNQRIADLEFRLGRNERYLTDILQSKRWKWANAITQPYRYVKSVLLNRKT